MTSVPRWVRRLAALALLAALLWAVYGLALTPLIAAYEAADASLEETRRLLAGYQRVARTAPVLEERLEKLKAQQTETRVYLRGATDALAAAELQDLLKRTIAEGGGQVRSVQSLPAQADSGFQRVTVRIQYTGPVPSLLHVLYELEAHKPLLFIDNLDIRANIRQRRVKSDDGEPMMLIVRFDVSGYLRPEADS